MIRLISLLIIVSLLGCNNHSTNQSSKDLNSRPDRDSLIKQYYGILEGLKLDYLLYSKKPFRSIMPTDSSEQKQFEFRFQQDSIKYFDCYNRFFSQNIDFVKWLLEFKNDTTKGDLWHMSLDPVSSYISECNLGLTNSRAAIILVENFLNGTGIICFECKFRDYNCNNIAYERVENFIKENGNKSLLEIRKEWKNIR
jgi:hypothetical protein